MHASIHSRTFLGSLASLARVLFRCAWVLVLPFAAALRAVPLPDRVEGWLYQETIFGPQNITANSGIRLNSDGSFAGVYANGGMGGRFGVSSPASGSWQYKKNADGTATLTLSDSLGARSLLVRGEENGTLYGSVSGISAAVLPSFRLTPPGSVASFSNSSIRTYVRPGGAAILGFILQNGGRTVLIRAVGPGLHAFGVPSTLVDPKLSVRSSGGALLNETDDWEHPEGLSNMGADSIRNTTTLVGAFALGSGSKDAATLLTLPSGAYTVQVNGVAPDDSGEVLIEVYALP